MLKLPPATNFPRDQALGAARSFTWRQQIWEAMLLFPSWPLAEKYTVGKYYLPRWQYFAEISPRRHPTCSTPVVLGSGAGPMGRGEQPHSEADASWWDAPDDGMLLPRYVGPGADARSLSGGSGVGRRLSARFRSHLLNSRKEPRELVSGGQHFPSCCLR